MDRPHDEDMEAEPQSTHRLDFVLQEECHTSEHAHVGLAKSDDSDDTDYSTRSDDFSESSDLPRSSTHKDSIEAKRDLVPKIDMDFESEKEAYNFYNEYGRLVGFSVRKSTVRKLVDGKVRKRVFCCNLEGYKDTRRRKTPPMKPRIGWRSGCLARMVIVIQPNGKYLVTEFEGNHNHNVAIDPKAALRSRYKELCRNFVKIAAKAAESEEAFNIVAGYLYKMLQEVEESLKRTHRKGYTSTTAHGTVTDSFTSGDTESLHVENADAFCELGGSVTDEAIHDDNNAVNVDNSKLSKMVRGVKGKEKDKSCGRKIKCAIEKQSKKNRPHNELPLAPQNTPPIQFTKGLHGSGVNPNESQLLNGHYLVPCMFPPPLPFMYQHSFPRAKQPLMPPVRGPLAPCYFRQSVGSSFQLSQELTPMSMHHHLFIGSSSQQEHKKEIREEG